ncbi:hypothetical protein E2C01_027728 [Portunus trituberculatus]|uniref:Uncharacterized protein n=1 Tax=Portunus trituberculatus TaxID=210409 RepID=A0A5B7EMY7_PORTR|nr:hypothetical protein [Portunus trituberculatus]
MEPQISLECHETTTSKQNNKKTIRSITSAHQSLSGLARSHASLLPSSQPVNAPYMHMNGTQWRSLRHHHGQEQQYTVRWVR